MYMLNIYIYIYIHEYMYMTIHFNYTYWTVTSGSFGSFSNTPKSLHNFTMLTTACFTAAHFFWFHTMAWKKLCNDKSLARSIQVTEQDEKTLAGWQDGYIQLMPTKIKRNKNSNLQHTTKNSEGFLFFSRFCGWESPCGVRNCLVANLWVLFDGEIAWGILTADWFFGHRRYLPLGSCFTRKIPKWFTQMSSTNTNVIKQQMLLQKNGAIFQLSWLKRFSQDMSHLGGGFKYYYFHLYLGKIPILTNIFQMGWFNH